MFIAFIMSLPYTFSLMPNVLRILVVLYVFEFFGLIYFTNTFNHQSTQIDIRFYIRFEIYLRS